MFICLMPYSWKRSDGAQDQHQHHARLDTAHDRVRMFAECPVSRILLPKTDQPPTVTLWLPNLGHDFLPKHNNNTLVGIPQKGGASSSSRISIHRRGYGAAKATLIWNTHFNNRQPYHHHPFTSPLDCSYRRQKQNPQHPGTQLLKNLNTTLSTNLSNPDTLPKHLWEVPKEQLSGLGPPLNAIENRGRTLFTFGRRD